MKYKNKELDDALEKITLSYEKVTFIRGYMLGIDKGVRIMKKETNRIETFIDKMKQ